MEKEINYRKIILTIYVFCVAIMVLSFSVAYFSMSVSSATNTVATTNNFNLSYSEEKNIYGDLIPSSFENALKGATNTTGNGICLDSNNHHVCSLYQFTITNNNNIDADIKIYLNTTINTFNNIKFIVYDGDITNLSNTSIIAQNNSSLTGASEVELESLRSTLAKINGNKTYTIMFYIEEINDIQLRDMGKQLVTDVRVEAVGTGKFISANDGSSCWTVEGHTLTAFNGIDMTTGAVDANCSSYVTLDASDNGYSITIPSSVGENTITTLGNPLFSSIEDINFETGEFTYNYYKNIKNIVFDDDSTITTISNGDLSLMSEEGSENYFAPFLLTGNNTGLSITLPDSLKTIGDYSFYIPQMTNLTIPANVTYIGKYAFSMPESFETKLQNVSFLGSSTNEDLVIDEGSFERNRSLSSLTLPGNLKEIGNGAFGGCNLTELTIPSSVEIIESHAFSTNRNLSNVTFLGINDNSSNLTTIGDMVFYNCNLNYQNAELPLIIPSRVTTVGGSAFNSTYGSNPKLKYIKVLATDTSGYAANWYDSTYTSLVP